MTGTIVITVKGITVYRRRYDSLHHGVWAMISDMLRSVESRHAVITVTPDVTDQVERKHCAKYRALLSRRL